jgi:two-component system, sensor histidine kinase
LNSKEIETLGRFSSQVDIERRKLFLGGAGRSPIPAIVMICFLAYQLAPNVGDSQAGLWAAANVAIFLLRLLGISWVLKQPSEYVNKPVVHFLICGTGLLIGGGALLAILAWFPHISESQRAVMTMMYVGWCAGGMASQGCYPFWTPFWTIPIFLGCVLAWAGQGDSFAWGMVVLIIIVFTLMTAGLMNSAKAIKESILAKLQNRELASEVLAQKTLIEHAARAKTSFLIAASHDLRQPAMGMGLLISAIKDSEDLPTAKKIAEGAERALGAMERILQALLEFSRLDTGQVRVAKSPFHLHELLQSLIDETRSTLQPGVSLTLNSDHFYIMSDPNLIEQIVRNLLSNAARFTERGSIKVHAVLVGSELSISVTDTGLGIAKEAQTSIFQEYFQIGKTTGARSKGLGLGLSIVEKSAKLLNAQVSVASQLGEGSTFRLQLPVEVLQRCADKSIRTSKEALSSPLKLTGKTVLVVDDDPIVRESFQTVLESYGVKVILCANPDTTLQLLKTSQGLIDTAFIDYQISDAYHGIDLIEAIREQWPLVKCILITGDVRKDVNERASQAQIRVIHKPLRVQKIVDIIEGKNSGQ